MSGPKLGSHAPPDGLLAALLGVSARRAACSPCPALPAAVRGLTETAAVDARFVLCPGQPLGMACRAEAETRGKGAR